MPAFRAAITAGGVDDRAPAGVEQHRPGLHAGQCIGVDQVAGLRCQWAMQTDHVAGGQHFWQFHVTHAERQTHSVGLRVVAEQLTTEARHDARETFADFSGADHPDGSSMQVEAEQPFQREIAFPYTGIGAVQMSVERQQQRDRVLGHCVR